MRIPFRYFSGSSHVRLVRLASAKDQEVWAYARDNGFVLVSLDSDFAHLAALAGPPPKVIWLRCGNQRTALIDRILRDHAALIAEFAEAQAACLEIY